MPTPDQSALQTLQQIAETIDLISLHDAAAWQDLGRRLERVRQDLSDPGDTAVTLLEGCAGAMQAVVARTAPNCLDAVDAIMTALDALARHLAAEGHPPDDAAALEAAVETLQAVCPVEPAAVPDPPGKPSTLDDAAAMLVQLDEADPAAAEPLAHLLEDLATRDDTPSAVRDSLGEAAAALAHLAAGTRSADDTRAVLTTVGDLLENAVAARERFLEGPSVGEPSAPAPHPAGADAAAEAVAAPPPEPAVDTGSDHAPGDAAPVDHLPAEADPDLLGEFVTESLDLITDAEEALLSLENDPGDMDAVDKVFRAFHTVKGTSAFMDLTVVSEMGHHAESLLSRVREREIRYSGGYADLALRALDMLKELVKRVERALGGAPLTKPDGYDELLALLADPEDAGISEECDEGMAPRLGDILVAQGKTTREDLEKAAETCSEAPLGRCLVTSEVASLEDVGQALRTQQRLRSNRQVVDSSVRVSTDRLDRLIDMVGEMVIAHSMVAQDDLITLGQHHELAKKVAHTGKIVRALQDMSMSLRMVPLKATFQKMTRLVRDLAKKVNKQVRLVTEGEDTEIDRNMVDVIKDPLVHMVRNAVDHGVETPEERRRRGKPDHGTVKLAAYHSAGSVVVEIQDDGRGLDRDAILAKARERGVIGPSDTPSERDIYNLVFEPGFSTAKAVTDVSGRGVGMDVVKKNIEALRGQVEIHSTPGRGSVFQMRLPLTLAIIDGMVVRVGVQSYVVPTLSIIRAIKPTPEDLATALSTGEMLSLQGRLIPLVRLAELFDVSGAEQDPCRALVVVVEDDRQQVGLVIDELVGRQQVVIKTLGETMREIPGISGSAVMPDGRVGLILDVGTLVALAGQDDDAQPLRAVG